MAKLNELEQDKVDMPTESKVGKKLSDLTTKRVIVLVLVMIFAIILLTPAMYYDAVTSMDFGIQIFNFFNSTDDYDFPTAFNTYINEHTNTSVYIVYLKVGNTTWGDPNASSLLRDTEKIESYDDCSNVTKNVNETVVD